MIALTLALLVTSTPPPVPDPATVWPPLIEAGDLAGARSRCEAWLRADDVHARAEAHKCLSNVEVWTAAGRAEAAAAAGRAGADARLAGLRLGVKHLDQALELAPEDLSIHQGRLHLLRVAGLMPEMVQALEDSLRRHPGADWLGAWKAYPEEYYRAERFEQAVLLYRVLDRHFPDDHEILSNMGAALAALERDDEALACFQRAVKLAPGDPIDTWNLARMYDFMDRVEEADRGYQRALSLESDEEVRSEKSCMYAAFLEKKRKDRSRACELQRKAGGCEQTACEPTR